MEVKAKLRHLRIAPRKVRLVVDMIRGEKVSEAKLILRFTVNRSSRPVLKLLNSAIANAKNDFSLDESNLYISEIRVDEGPKLKRWMPRARGVATEIQKKTSHVILTLDEINKTKMVAKKKKAVAKPEVLKVDQIKESAPEKKKTRKDSSQKITAERGVSSKKMFRRKSI